MKRIAALLLVLALCLALTGCGKSEAAKAADELINAIGSVTLDSEGAITAAEKAVEALEEKDKNSLEGLDVLKKAREDFEALVDADKVAAVEKIIDEIGDVTLDSSEAIEKAKAALSGLESRLQGSVKNASKISEAEEAYLAAQAKVVEDAIDAIGTVTLESGEAIENAQRVYDEAAAEVQAKVSNFALIQTARDSLTALKAKGVDDLIAAIGEVSAESGEAIKAAQDALSKLTDEESAKVTKKAELDKAVADFAEMMKAQAETLLASFKKDEDKIRSLAFYYPSVWSWYDSSTWAADKRSFILPYLGTDASHAWVRTVYDYTGNDWIFWTKLTVVADGQKFYEIYKYNDIVRDNSGGRVWEYYDDEANLDMLRAIAASEETIARFEGKNYSADIEISASDKAAIQQVVDAYDALIGSGTYKPY